MRLNLRTITPELVAAIRKQYRLDWSGIHGIEHWGRVLENGLKLADTTGANRQIISLFAVFHDACRWNDSHDPEHGERGAALATAFHGRYFTLSAKELSLLQIACTFHTTGSTHPDVTVQTCWDSDRLDLLRVGIQPDPRRLCTTTAKTPAMIQWACHQALSGEATWLAQTYG